jgi:hypothetical protein
VLAGSEAKAGQHERHQQAEAREVRLHANIYHENIGSDRDA